MAKNRVPKTFLVKSKNIDPYSTKEYCNKSAYEYITGMYQDSKEFQVTELVIMGKIIPDWYDYVDIDDEFGSGFYYHKNWLEFIDTDNLFRFE